MRRRPAFANIDIHTHLHPDRLARAIRRWFADALDVEARSPLEPEEVAGLSRGERGGALRLFLLRPQGGIARDYSTPGLHGVRPAGACRVFPWATVHPDDPDMMEVAEEALVG
jgi:hypothetical protein